jgi:hypothetical protein
MGCFYNLKVDTLLMPLENSIKLFVITLSYDDALRIFNEGFCHNSQLMMMLKVYSAKVSVITLDSDAAHLVTGKRVRVELWSLSLDYHNTYPKKSWT